MSEHLCLLILGNYQPSEKTIKLKIQFLAATASSARNVALRGPT
jgi:hypothetical protein